MKNSYSMAKASQAEKIIARIKAPFLVEIFHFSGKISPISKILHLK
jgi:hypothetical protein